MGSRVVVGAKDSTGLAHYSCAVPHLATVFRETTMIVIRDAPSMSNIADPLVQQRYAEISAAGEVHFVIVQVGDTVAEIEQQCGFPILRNWLDDTCFGDAGFTPCFEALEEHARCYEMAFILNDDGYGIDIFIPKVIGIDPELLAMCTQYAVPAPKVLGVPNVVDE